MADRIVHDEDSWAWDEGLEIVHGHRGHRNKYPDTPGPPLPPASGPRGMPPIKLDEARKTVKRVVM